MKKLIIGNWKCNPTSLKKAEAMFRASDIEGAVVCPPFPFLSAGSSLKGAFLGAQDVYFGEGAFTGEVSAGQLKSMGVRYVIVGHSERRAMGETDEAVLKKTEAVVKAGMKAVVCVGESASERKKKGSERFVAKQVSVVKDLVSSGKVIFAYEPVWAIGTGNAATPEDAASMARVIRSVCASDKAVVLYGGSVSSSNAGEFLVRSEVGGLLVGGASLDPKEFGKICRGAR